MTYTDKEKNAIFNLLIYIRSTRDLPNIYDDKILQYLFNYQLIIPHMYDWTEDGPLFGGYYLTKHGRSFLKTIGKTQSKRIKRHKRTNKKTICEWGKNKSYRDDDKYFSTGCNDVFYFDYDGTLEENNFQHCPYCGGKIKLNFIS